MVSCDAWRWRVTSVGMPAAISTAAYLSASTCSWSYSALAISVGGRPAAARIERRGIRVQALHGVGQIGAVAAGIRVHVLRVCVRDEAPLAVAGQLMCQTRIEQRRDQGLCRDAHFAPVARHRR